MHNINRSNTLPMVNGGDALEQRINNGEKVEEIFVYAGNTNWPLTEDPPRGSDSRMAVLELPIRVSPTAVYWPVKGFEILAFTHGYAVHAIQLLAQELIRSGAVRISVNHWASKGFQFHGLYAQPEIKQ